MGLADIEVVIPDGFEAEVIDGALHIKPAPKKIEGIAEVKDPVERAFLDDGIIEEEDFFNKKLVCIKQYPDEHDISRYIRNDIEIGDIKIYNVGDVIENTLGYDPEYWKRVEK